MSHPFFKDINSEQIFKKEIDAPYKPKIEQLTYKLDKVDFNDPNL